MEGETAPLQARLEERIGAIAEGIARAAGLETAGVELRGGGRQRWLRVFLDRPGGAITLADCEAVSRQLGAVLDAEDLIPGDISYTLEVSSPGLDRRLVKTADFQRFAGEKVRVELRPRPGVGRRRFTGVLEGLSADNTKLRLRPEDAAVMELGREELASVRLVPRV
jgi:ribosome maturation factor RimP